MSSHQFSQDQINSFVRSARLWSFILHKITVISCKNPGDQASECFKTCEKAICKYGIKHFELSELINIFNDIFRLESKIKVEKWYDVQKDSPPSVKLEFMINMKYCPIANKITHAYDVIKKVTDDQIKTCLLEVHEDLKYYKDPITDSLMKKREIFKSDVLSRLWNSFLFDVQLEDYEFSPYYILREPFSWQSPNCQEYQKFVDWSGHDSISRCKSVLKNFTKNVEYILNIDEEECTVKLQTIPRSEVCVYFQYVQDTEYTKFMDLRPIPGN